MRKVVKHLSSLIGVNHHVETLTLVGVSTSVVANVSVTTVFEV